MRAELRVVTEEQDYIHGAKQRVLENIDRLAGSQTSDEDQIYFAAAERAEKDAVLAYAQHLEPLFEDAPERKQEMVAKFSEELRMATAIRLGRVWLDRHPDPVQGLSDMLMGRDVLYNVDGKEILATAGLDEMQRKQLVINPWVSTKRQAMLFEEELEQAEEASQAKADKLEIARLSRELLSGELGRQEFMAIGMSGGYRTEVFDGVMEIINSVDARGDDFQLAPAQARRATLSGLLLSVEEANTQEDVGVASDLMVAAWQEGQIDDEQFKQADSAARRRESELESAHEDKYRGLASELNDRVGLTGLTSSLTAEDRRMMMAETLPQVKMMIDLGVSREGALSMAAAVINYAADNRLRMYATAEVVQSDVRSGVQAFDMEIAGGRWTGGVTQRPNVEISYQALVARLDPQHLMELKGKPERAIADYFAVRGEEQLVFTSGQLDVTASIEAVRDAFHRSGYGIPATPAAQREALKARANILSLRALISAVQGL